MRAYIPVFLILAAAACSSPADGILEPPGDGPPTVPVVVFSSLHSGIEQEARFAIRSAAAWAAFWDELHATGTDVDPRAPHVDFTSSMVVVAALGARERAGYRIALPAFHHDAGQLAITVLKTSPGPTCPASPVFTTPAAIAVVPAAPAITFLEVEEQSSCPPP
jgi:hypothetical protein